MIWTILIGLIVGIVARLLLPGREALPGGILGWILTALLGSAGGFLGGWIAGLIWPSAAGGGIMGFVFAVIGAILLLLIVRLLFGRGNAA